jgi:hypothetical protein
VTVTARAPFSPLTFVNERARASVAASAERAGESFGTPNGGELGMSSRRGGNSARCGEHASGEARLSRASRADGASGTGSAGGVAAASAGALEPKERVVLPVWGNFYAGAAMRGRDLKEILKSGIRETLFWEC